MKSTFTLLTLKKWNRHLARITVIVASMILLSLPVFSQITGTSAAARCGEGAVILRATGSGTINWYSGPFYGTPVGTGENFTTPELVVTTTYYVDAIDGSGCSVNPNKERVPVTATISTSAIQASIFYASTTFCTSVATPEMVTRTGTAGGVYSYTGGGTLSLNTSTGAITPSTSTVGTYTITYTVTAAEGCIENPATTPVTITNAPLTSSISYSGSPFCTSETSISVNLTNPNSGTYSASPSGLSINATTGTINPSLSLPGTYTVTYVVSGAGGCAPQEPTTSVSITGLPTAAISYTDAPYCKDLASAQTPILTGTGAYTGGTYSATGITINASTGAITPSTSNAGTYTIYYTAPASGNCATVQVSTPLTINPLPTASIAGTISVCQNAAEPDVTFTGITGTAPFTFTYKVGSGANQTATTTSGSSVTVAQPTTSAGSYVYTLVSVADANGCSQAASGTVTITVTGTPVADFSYIGSPFCKTGSVLPTLAPGGSAGTFSGTNVVFVSTTTGEINLASTPAGTYEITNTISTCGTPVVATTSITINALPTASIEGSTACGSSVLTATTDATSPSFVWYKDDVVIPNETASTLTASADGAYKVKVTDGSNGCEITSAPHSVTLIALPTASITGTLSTCATPTILTAVSNAASPSYVWYKNDEEIVEETVSTLTATGSGNYKVKVNNGVTSCENTSEAVFVSIALVDDPGVIDGGQTVCTDVANSTELTSTGTKSTILRWEESSDGNTWTTIDNTSSTYTATGLTQTTLYRVAVQNGICSEAYSVPATVTIVADPAITVQPTASTTECIGGTAQLSVTATDGTPSLTYQWYTNASNNNTSGTLIPGATASTYIPSTASAGTVYYYVYVAASGSGCGNATSDVAAVTTVATSPSWTAYSNPTPTSICAGETVAFSVSVTGGSGGTVSWIRSASSGGVGTTVTTGDIPAAGTWYYRPHYTPTSSGCTLADGNETIVTVNPLPTITTTGTVASVTNSASAQTSTLAYTTTTNSPTSYSINWDATANTAGLADQGSTAFTFIAGGGSLTGIAITAATPAGIYNGTMTITTANGCVATQAVTVTVIPLAPTGSAAQSFCSEGGV